MLFFLRGRLSLLRVIITIIILWSFAYVTGLTPSVLRATLMFSFLQAGKAMKREVNGINSVLASAFVLILIRPSVIFDAGFLLSYAAVIYIISFYQGLYTRIQFRQWLPDKIWQAAVITIVAQAGTLPLTIMLFNRFPTYFILTNILIVPLSSLVIILGCLVPLTFHIHFLSQFFATCLNWLTGFTELLTLKAASLPFSTIENLGMTSFECFLLTITIFLFFYSFLNRRIISSFYPLMATLIYVSAGTLMSIFSGTTNELIVFNSIRSSTIGIKTGNRLHLYSDSLPPVPEVKRYCSTRRMKIIPEKLSSEDTYIKTGGKVVLITGSLRKRVLQDFRPDIVIITGDRHEILHETSGFKPPDALIVTSGVSARLNYQKSGAFNEIDTVHFVKQTGAFKTAI
jgi:competence protein ComEC